MESELELKPRREECVDCGESFNLTAGERRFFARKHLTEPKRCLSCRKLNAKRSVTAQEVRHAEQ